MTIKTVRGLVSWLKSERDKAVIEDEAAFNFAVKNDFPYDIDNDTIFKRITFFSQALRVVQWTFPGEDLDSALRRVKRFIDSRPYLAPEFLRKQLMERFPGKEF